jgi:hypothetical protein
MDVSVRVFSIDAAHEDLVKGTDPEYHKPWPKIEIKKSKDKSVNDIEILSIDQEYEELQKGKVFDPGAVAASIGRKKYGAKKFAEMSAHGKNRKKAPKGKAKMAPGGGGRFAKLESEIASKNKGKK